MADAEFHEKGDMIRRSGRCWRVYDDDDEPFERPARQSDRGLNRN